MFEAILNWFKGFFAKVAETVIGKAAEEMSDAAIEIVNKVEEKPSLSGRQKFNRAEKALKNRYPSAESAAINLAIESAVALMEDTLDGNDN